MLLALGCSGSDGKNGANGRNGADGADGADGKDGKTGAQGPAGPAGPRGPAGPAGPSGSAGAAGDTGIGAAGSTGVPEGTLTAGCLSPCHGFTGIVEEWKTSRHYSTYIANLGGDEATTWTGAQACGNCHAIDAIQQRVEGNVGTADASDPPAELANGELNYYDSTSGKVLEATYAGQATVAVVHCTTCHDVTADNDPHRTGAEYVPGSFPFRVPTGTSDYATLEKSSAVGTVDGTPAGNYREGNVCVWCHRSRKDVTNYITATNKLTSAYWGPHEGPDADVFTGKGGYHYGSNKYAQSTHSVSLKHGCVDCHMPSVSSNQDIGDHSFYPQFTACQKSGCHQASSSIDDLERRSGLKDILRDLRTALNDQGWLTRDSTTNLPLTTSQLADDNFREDVVAVSSPTPATLTADQAGALYNYLILARGGAFGVHNPTYLKQLVYDSYEAVVGTAPPSLPTRP